jgi:hypothetical protein
MSSAPSSARSSATPGGGHQLRSLDGWRRWATLAAVVVLGLLPLAVAGRSLAAGWEPTGDVAVIGVRSLDAWTTQAPLVGQPTTGREVSGVDSFHPGPLQNWLSGPLLRTLGPAAGLALGAALVNGAALAAVAWLSFRRGGPVLAATSVGATGLLVHALGPASLFDPYNSELPTYALLACALAAWCVLAGDVVALPVLVVAGSVAAQAHVAGATSAAPFVAIALGGLAWSLRRSPERWREQRTPILLSAALALVCWLPPLAQELVGPSNLSALLRTATADGTALGIAFTLERVATALAPVPLWARRSGAYGFLEDQGALGVLAAALIVGAAGSLALAARWVRGRREPALLSLAVGVALLVTVLVWSGSPPVTAFRVDSIRWLWVLGLLVWLALAWATWAFVPASVRRTAQRGATAALAAIVAVTATWAVTAADLDEVRDQEFMAPVAELGDDAVAELEPGRYRVRASGAEATVTVLPAVVLRLEDAGIATRFDPSPFTVGYGPDRVADPTQTTPTAGTIVVASDERPAGRLLAEATVVRDDGQEVPLWVVLEGAP